MDSTTFSTYILPVVYLLLGIGAGLAAEKVIFKRLRLFVAKTRWKGDEVFLAAFKGLFLFWGMAGSAWLAVHKSQISGIHNFVTVFDKLIFSCIVLSACMVLGRILVGFIRVKTVHVSGLRASSSIISNIVRIIIYLLGILVILQTLGISITPVLTALGVGGLAVALALQDTLSNLFSGIQIIASRQLRTGDYVKLSSGDEGYVMDISWRNTIIRALSNNLIIVPNSKVASTIITNYYLPETETAVLVEVGVDYNSNLDLVEKIAVDTAQQVMKNTEGGIVKNFEPFIRYHTFGETSIQFTVILRGREFTDQYLIKHDFIKALHKRFNENAITIPYPTRNIIIKQPQNKTDETSTINNSIKPPAGADNGK